MEIIDDVAELQERKGSADTGLTLADWGGICEEIALQPEWRYDADKCNAYYDGNQYTAKDLAEFEQIGIPPVMVNLVKPAVNLLLGLEAKTRRDWRVSAEDSRWQAVSEGIGQKLSEMERETYADRSISNAYGSQIKSGIGWVEVNRSSDPFKYSYRIKDIHRREMFWDWSATEQDLDDATYLVRQKWFPQKTVMTFFPQHADLIAGAWSGSPDFILERYREHVEWAADWNRRAQNSLGDMEWRNPHTKMMRLYEVWTRVYKRGYIMRIPGAKPVEFDKRNPVHAEAVSRGLAFPQMAVYKQLQRSIWMGPFRLAAGTPRSRRLPYIPFWGYRQDVDGSPYGVIRDWLSPQDEYNARRQKLLWLLSAKRMMIDNDALDTSFQTIDDLIAEIARPDFVAVLKASRTNKDALRIESDLGLSAQQFNVMMQDREAFRQATGIHQPAAGESQGDQSGIALQTLVEQSDTAYAEINDNYRYARRLVGEAAMDLIVEDIGGQPVDIVVGEDGRRRIISLNIPAVDEETGVQYLENDVQRAPVKVVLSDVPSTQSFMQQQNMVMGEVIKMLPDNLKAILIPYWIETTDMPKRKEAAKLIRKTLGLPDGNLTPEEEQAIGDAQAQAQEIQQQLTMRAAEAEIGLKEAQAVKMLAEAEKAKAEIGQLGMDPQAGVDAAVTQAQMEFDAKANEMLSAHDERMRALQEEMAKVRRDAEKNVMQALEEARRAKDGHDYDLVKAKMLADIGKEQALEIERLRQKGQKDEAGVVDALKKLGDELKGKIKEFDQKLKEQAKETEQRLKEAEMKRREEDLKRREKEAEDDKAEKEKEGKEEKGGEKEQQPIVVNITNVIPKPGAKTVEMTRPDGSKVTGTVKEDDS